MDILFILVGGMVTMILFAAALENPEYKFFVLIPLLFLIWGVVATSTKEPKITQHKVHTIVMDDGGQTQIIFYNENPVNITEKLGKILEDGTTIERVSDVGVWSLGVHCIAGDVTYRKLETTSVEK